MGAKNGIKRLISVRISQPDHAKVKQLAARLGARESDVLRFALKSTLARLNPLFRPDSAGREVLSVFIDHGQELVNYFELDTDRLDEIVNGSVSDPAQRVDREDLALISAAGRSEHYVSLKLSEIRGEKIDPEQLAAELRRYLVGKYVRQGRP
jgi:hypothetical protein